jgi:hypothetical protein
VDHPALIVSPSSQIKDGMTVSVTVTGFGSGGKVWLSECASAAAATDLGCGGDLASQPFLVTDDNGTGSSSLVVHAHAAGRPPSPVLVKCADQCVVVATLGEGFAFVTSKIGFAP